MGFYGFTYDSEFCKRVVGELGCVAFDVDYRLAPEDKFPVPVEDCWAAFNWVRILLALQNQLQLLRRCRRDEAFPCTEIFWRSGDWKGRTNGGSRTTTDVTILDASDSRSEGERVQP